MYRLPWTSVLPYEKKNSKSKIEEKFVVLPSIDQNARRTKLRVLLLCLVCNDDTQQNKQANEKKRSSLFVDLHCSQLHTLSLIQNIIYYNNNNNNTTIVYKSIMDQVKSIAVEKLRLLRSKLDQIPALQDVEVSYVFV